MRPRLKTFWKYAFIPLLANTMLAAHLVSLDPGWHGLKGVVQRMECLAGRQPVLAQGLRQGFATGPAPAQRILSQVPEAARLEATDTPGWSQYAVPEGAASQVLTFEVLASGEALVFYPRASGTDSSVEVALVQGGKPRTTARLKGQDGRWTPMGAKWILPLACVDKEAPLTVRVTLVGPWAQLWTRGGETFFEQ